MGRSPVLAGHDWSQLDFACNLGKSINTCCILLLHASKKRIATDVDSNNRIGREYNHNYYLFMSCVYLPASFLMSVLLTLSKYSGTRLLMCADTRCACEGGSVCVCDYACVFAHPCPENVFNDQG